MKGREKERKREIIGEGIERSGSRLQRSDRQIAPQLFGNNPSHFVKAIMRCEHFHDDAVSVSLMQRESIAVAQFSVESSL